MKTAAAHEVRVTRRIHATAERVFRAFTTPGDLERWYAPQGMTVPSAQLELRVGGAFRIEMKAPDGTLHTAHGVYREISPPNRLSHTWNWEKPMEGEAGETMVTIELRPDGDYTEVTLVHSGFTSASGVGNHEKGWTSILDRLVEQFQ